MESAEVSQNVILAVIAAPLISAIVDLVKRRGAAWMTEGMVPALIAEAIGVMLGVISYFTVSPLYSVPGSVPVHPSAPLAYYIAGGFVIGLTAVGLHAQYKAGQQPA